MGIRNYITDIASGLKAKVDNRNGSEENALVVATRPLKSYDPRVALFVNETFGSSMNINAAASGQEYIHDGLDNVYWTGSIIVSFPGDFVFDDATQNHTPGGTQSINFTDSEDADICQFLRPAGVLDLSGYVTLSGWIYITLWPTTGTKEINFYGWDTGTATQVGTQVDVGNYVTTTTLNTWQKFTIPLSDMGLTNQSIDALRFQMVDVGVGAAAEGFFDDIQLDFGGLIPPQDYIIRPSAGSWYHVVCMSFAMVTDAYNPVHTILTTEEVSMPKISYDGFLGVSLADGLRFTIDNGETQFSTIYRNLGDIISQPGTVIKYGYDGTNTWLVVEIGFENNFGAPYIIRYEDDDKMTITVSDNLSSFSTFRVTVTGREETRS